MNTEDETRPIATGAGPKHNAATTDDTTISPMENAQLRIYRDIWLESQALYWERRAEALQWCRPRPTDYTGRATPEQIAARDARLATEIEQCHAHAAILRSEASDHTHLTAVRP